MVSGKIQVNFLGREEGDIECWDAKGWRSVHLNGFLLFKNSFSLQMRSGKGIEDREMVFVYYKKVKAPSDSVQENLASIFKMLSNTDGMDNSVCAIQLKGGIVNCRE